jgi:nitroreductase
VLADGIAARGVDGRGDLPRDRRRLFGDCSRDRDVSRFKYGLRGYRFVLLEAGHLAQNVLLVCEGLRLAAVPIGGFYDRPLDDLLGADGVNESILYAVCLGRRPIGENR